MMGQVKSILSKAGLSPKKWLGQHFLVDNRVVDVMIKSVSPESSDVVIEIGPGLGALTASLARTAGVVAAIELDRDMVGILNGNLTHYNNLRIINNDFLKLDLVALISELSEALREQGVAAPAVKVVGSLPYYVTSEIITSLLTSPIKPTTITLLIQKEVAVKLTAKPKTAGYGLLTLTASYYAGTEIVAHVPPDAFYPPPSVESTVVRLTPLATPTASTEKAFLFSVIRMAFSSRRKTLLNNIAAAGIVGLTKSKAEAVIKEAGISANARGEELYLEDYDRLCHAITRMLKI